MIPSYIKINKYTKYVLIGLGLLIVFSFLGFSDKSPYRKYIAGQKQIIKRADSIQKVLDQSDLIYLDVLGISRDSVLVLKASFPRLYEGLIKYQIKDAEIQSVKNDIVLFIASDSKLDSLAENVTFK